MVREKTPMSDLSLREVEVAEIKNLDERYPGVSDKAVIDAVCGLRVSRRAAEIQVNRGPISKLIARITGKASEEAVISQQNLITSVEGAIEWLTDLSKELDLTQHALILTQTRLRESMGAIRGIKEREEAIFREIDELYSLIQRLTETVGERFERLEARISNLELRVTAWEVVQNMRSALRAGRIYGDLPWPIQVILTSRAISRGDVGVFANRLPSCQRLQFLQRVSDSLIETFQSNLSLEERESSSLARLVDYSFRNLGDDRRYLVWALMDQRNDAAFGLPESPFHTIFGEASEFSLLPTLHADDSIGDMAFGVARLRLESPPPRTVSLDEFVSCAVKESFDASRSGWGESLSLGTDD